MAVLEDDLLNLEIEPVKVYLSLSQEKRVKLGLGNITSLQDGSELADHPAMKNILSKGFFFFFFLRENY